MKFACSTASFPGEDIDTILRSAREWGYDGVELRASGANAASPADHAMLADPHRTRGVCESAGVEIACLATTVCHTGRARDDTRAAGEVLAAIHSAAALGCRSVKLLDGPAPRGYSKAAAAVTLGSWLLPLGDAAAGQGVVLAVENACAFRTAHEMWEVLDRLDHPAIACCWDGLTAMLAGEAPEVSVPVLNTRIQYAYVADAHFTANGAAYCGLGEGDVPLQRFITRLLGIGYGGYVTVRWDRVAMHALAEAQTVLPAALETLRRWKRQAAGIAPPPTQKAASRPHRKTGAALA